MHICTYDSSPGIYVGASRLTLHATGVDLNNIMVSVFMPLSLGRRQSIRYRAFAMLQLLILRSTGDSKGLPRWRRLVRHD